MAQLPANDVSEYESLFQTLLTTTASGVLVIDERGTVEVYSPGCERLFQYAPEEVLGRNVSMLMPEPHRHAHDGYIKRYRETGKAHIIGVGREVEGRRKDGSRFPFRLMVGEGRVRGKRVFLGIVHDLSDRKAQETRLERLNAELSHVARLGEMSQVSAGIAHELNQPLSAMLNYTNAAKRLINAGDEASLVKAYEAVSKAGEQAARASQIIRRLRDFLERRETSRTAEDINAIAEDALALGLIGSKAAGITTHLDFAAASPPILVDRVQIQQVLVNLLRNAVEAMAESPRRELTVKTASIDGAGVEVAVADTGSGIPEEIVGRLFKPFVTTKYGGMGIGLAISRSIVEAHGGTIRSLPNEGGGTVFRFTLPAAPAEAA